MPFKLIKGTFHVQGYSPDGDTLRFKPENLKLLDGLQGFRPKINGRFHVSLRIEAIDALETHYSSTGGMVSQPLTLAHKAMERLFAFTGISNVIWNENRTLILSAVDGMKGYILTRSVEKNGRVISFIFSGNSPEADGSEIMFDVTRLRQSYNYQLMAEGLGYPTYYRGLFSDLRNEITAAVHSARQQGLGIHAIDQSLQGFNADNIESITKRYAILPKLFRRLADYIGFNGSAIGFKKKLAEYKEPVLDLRENNFTHFDTFIEQDEGSTIIVLSRLPEELVFDEMPLKPVNAFAEMLIADAEKNLIIV